MSEMLEATQTWTCDYDGEREVITAGRTRVAPDHELAERFPSRFRRVPSHGVADRDGSEWRATGPDGRQRALVPADALEERIREAAQRPGAREAGADPGNGSRSSRGGLDSTPQGQARDAALRAIDRQANVLSPRAGDRLASLVERDQQGMDSRYIAAVSDPAYERAFLGLLARPDYARNEFSEAEAAALREVGVASSARAMSIGDPTAGGYGVPFALDPTINLTSDGAVNPLRELATVTPILTNEWRGITSAGVSASFAPEATEVGDGTPTLAQPAIKAEKGQMFVPYSIEVGMDYANFGQELAALFADAKDQLEAEKFVLGSGTDEPEGLIAGLAGSSLIDTAGSGAFAIGDVYTLQEALPPRFQPRATWLATNSIANRIYRFAGTGSVEPEPFSDDRTTLLGKPYRELSTMSSTVSAGQKILAYGDLSSAFRIVERIGLQVELVQHLFGTVANRPTGQRGLYAWFRVGSAVTIDNALRVATVKS